MIRNLFLLAMAAGMVAATPLEAQQNCRRERTRPEREQRDRRRPEERARDSLQAAIRVELTRDARAAARAAGVAEPSGIFLVSYDKGQPEKTEFRTWRSNVPNEVLAGVLERALPRLEEWPDREPATLNLRLDSIPPADTTATHVVTCYPVLENRAEINDLVSTFASENVELIGGPGRQRTAEVRMLVSREGEVVHADVWRSSGNSRVDGFALQLALRMRFRPPSIAGRTTDVWVSLPVTLQAREGRARGSAPRP